MASKTLSVNMDSIHDQVHTTVRELCSRAERIRIIAASIEDSAGELLRYSPAEDLRRAGAIVKIHAMGMLLTVIEVAGRAERLEAIATIRDASDSPESDSEAMRSK